MADQENWFSQQGGAIKDWGSDTTAKAFAKAKAMYKDSKSKYISKHYSITEDPYGGPIGYLKEDVGEEYVITIHDDSPQLYQGGGVRTSTKKRREIFIRTLMQEKFEMGTKSEWRPMTAATLLTRLGIEPTAWFGRTPLNRWVTRRVWTGTTPLQFSLNLKFIAEDDAEREVLLPCQELQRMCLPYRGEKIKGDWFLSPPGPSMIQWWTPEGGGRGEIITITIGALLQIKKCVVHDVKVIYPPAFLAGGLPMYANVNITFETYEIQTKESLNTEVYLKGGRPEIASVQSQRPSSSSITSPSCSSGVCR